MDEQRTTESGLTKKLKLGTKVACSAGLGVVAVAGLAGFGTCIYMAHEALQQAKELPQPISGTAFMVGFFGAVTLGTIGTSAGKVAYDFVREIIRGDYNIKDPIRNWMNDSSSWP